MDIILQKILNIEADNKFLIYIVGRVQQDNYRGVQISQHNRYTLEVVKIIFEEIYKVANGNLFSVPVGDYSNADRVLEAKIKYPEFSKIVESINSRLERTTINSLKKNFFLDFTRAGFMERFDKNKQPLDPCKRSTVHYAQLKQPAIELANEDDVLKRYYIFSRQIDLLFRDHISKLANTIYNSNYKDDSLLFVEFQYIFSDSKLSGDEKIDLLDSYRSLSTFGRSKVDELLKEYCAPNRVVASNKTMKRDYGNWRNETQQIMYLLKNTIYFQIRDDSFALNTSSYGIFPKTTSRQRSSGVKQEYFDRHKIEKKEKFELHHIVPIAYAKNKNEFRLVDNFRNLIYLNKDKHQQIKKNNILLSIDKNFASFLDIYEKIESIEAKNNKDAFYNDNFVDDMDMYNKKLLRSILDYK